MQCQSKSRNVPKYLNWQSCETLAANNLNCWMQTLATTKHKDVHIKDGSKSQGSVDHALSVIYKQVGTWILMLSY